MKISRAGASSSMMEMEMLNLPCTLHPFGPKKLSLVFMTRITFFILAFKIAQAGDNPMFIRAGFSRARNLASPA
jgi:hypothetical protein